MKVYSRSTVLQVTDIVVVTLSSVIEKNISTVRGKTSPRSTTFDKPNQKVEPNCPDASSLIAGGFGVRLPRWRCGRVEGRSLDCCSSFHPKLWPPSAETVERGGCKASPSGECFALQVVFVTPRLIYAHPSLPRFRAVLPLTPLWCFPRPTAWRCFCAMKMRGSMWTHTAESLKTWCSSGERCPPLLVGLVVYFTQKLLFFL